MGTTAAFVRADNDNGAAVSDVTPLAHVSIRTAVVRMYPAAQSVKEEAGQESVRASSGHEQALLGLVVSEYRVRVLQWLNFGNGCGGRPSRGR